MASVTWAMTFSIAWVTWVVHSQDAREAIASKAQEGIVGKVSESLKAPRQLEMNTLIGLVLCGTGHVFPRHLLGEAQPSLAV